MADDIRDTSQESTSGRTGGGKKEVNIFPALTERRPVVVRPAAAQQRLGTQISIFTPVSFEEALEIVECLRGRAATTISLENMKKMDAGRLVDFVAGASAALDGDFHKLSEQVYLFCPSNIKITAARKEGAIKDAIASRSSLDIFPQGGILGSLANTSGELDFLYPNNASLGKPQSGNAWTGLQ